jgi:hypothetical protein
MPWRGTTFLRKPTLVYCNINDLQPIPTPQLLKISITRQKRPEMYWRYVYGSCAVLLLCAMVLLWAIVSPESF